MPIAVLPQLPAIPLLSRQVLCSRRQPDSILKHRPAMAAHGNATASATGTSTHTVNVIANGYGGPGGNAGSALSGNGGNGAVGAASATGVNAGSNIVQVTANAVGGNGYAGSGTGFSGRTRASCPSLGTASGTSSGGGAVNVTATATGGSGGAGVSGATGANGITVNLSNMLTGSTTGSLNFTQQAIKCMHRRRGQRAQSWNSRRCLFIPDPPAKRLLECQ